MSDRRSREIDPTEAKRAAARKSAAKSQHYARLEQLPATVTLPESYWDFMLERGLLNLRPSELAIEAHRDFAMGEFVAKLFADEAAALERSQAPTVRPAWTGSEVVQVIDRREASHSATVGLELGDWIPLMPRLGIRRPEDIEQHHKRSAALEGYLQRHIGDLIAEREAGKARAAEDEAKREAAKRYAADYYAAVAQQSTRKPGD